MSVSDGTSIRVLLLFFFHSFIISNSVLVRTTVDLECKMGIRPAWDPWMTSMQTHIHTLWQFDIAT